MTLRLPEKKTLNLFLWVGTGLATGVIGLAYTDLARSEWVIGHLGYPFAWILAALCLLALWKSREDMARVITAHRIPLGLLAILAGAIAMTEPRFMKVTWDEQVHAAVAYGAHAEGRIIQPIAMTRNPGGPGGPAFDYLSVSFRGYGMSWIVSILYDVFGPDVRWVYAVNFAAGVVALWAAYSWCFLLCRNKAASLAAGLLLAGASVFGVVMNSGAYDMLNLALLLSLGAAVTRWRERPGENETLTIACLASALAVTRIESVAYYAVVLWVMFMHIQKDRTRPGFIGMILPFMPALLLPNFALQKVLNGTPYNLHQGHLKEGLPLLSVDYLLTNLRDTGKFLINLTPFRGGSIVLVVATLAGVTWLVRAGAGRSDLRKRYAVPVFFAVMSTGLYVMVMCSFWGGPGTNPQMTRFTLPLCGIMTVLGAAGFGEAAGASKTRPLPLGLCLLAAASCQLIFVTAPFHLRGESRKLYPFACAVDEVSGWVDKTDTGKTLYVSRATSALISRGKICVNEGVFTRENASLMNRLNNGEYNRFVHMRKATEAPLCDRENLPPELHTGWVEIFRTHSGEGNMMVLDEWRPTGAPATSR